MRYSRLFIASTTICVAATLHAQTRSLPDGFTRIFNGRDLSGWHVSRSNHHGTTGEWRVEKGALVAAQRPLGQGGILLTDRKYKDFELFLEVNPDHDTDGGIFLRSTETGSGYQVDLTPRGQSPPVMNLLGEDLRVGPRTDLTERRPTQGVWKLHEWNAVRIRMIGEAPRVTLWLNDTLIWDVQQARNDLLADATDGMIALQLHWSAWGALDPPSKPAAYAAMMWKPGAVHPIPEHCDQGRHVMRRAAPTAAGVALAIGAVASAHAQSPAPTTTNSIGMELVLIEPGPMLVGRYTRGVHRPYPQKVFRAESRAR